MCLSAKPRDLFLFSSNLQWVRGGFAFGIWGANSCVLDICGGRTNRDSTRELSSPSESKTDARVGPQIHFQTFRPFLKGTGGGKQLERFFQFCRRDVFYTGVLQNQNRSGATVVGDTKLETRAPQTKHVSGQNVGNAWVAERLIPTPGSAKCKGVGCLPVPILSAETKCRSPTEKTVGNQRPRITIAGAYLTAI